MQDLMSQLQPAKYIYCIIPCQEERTFDVVSIGGSASTVHTIVWESLAVIASDSANVRYESTRSNMMAHQKVLEKVMQEYTLLPVRFGTIANSTCPIENIQKLLSSRFQEFSQLLQDMQGKVEMGLKAFWRDEKAVFTEIMAENPEIRRLRDRLARKPAEIVRFEGVPLGKMVKEALDHKRSQEADEILAPLRPLAEQVRENVALADRIVLNAAFLIDADRSSELDHAVEELDREHGDRLVFKYVGPTPPYNFVDIVVSWE